MAPAKSHKSLNQPERTKIANPFGFAYRPNQYFKFLFLFQKNGVCFDMLLKKQSNKSNYELRN
jgi:hypothetical protein